MSLFYLGNPSANGYYPRLPEILYFYSLLLSFNTYLCLICIPTYLPTYVCSVIALILNSCFASVGFCIPYINWV